MPDSDNKISQQLKDDHDRTLRSASPAVKRPAADMGGQEREEHATDVGMSESSGSGHAASVVQPDSTQDSVVRQENGKRLRSEDSFDTPIPTESNPRSTGQQAPSELAAASVTPVSSCSPHKTHQNSIPHSEPSVAPADLPSIDDQVLRITELVKAPLEDKQKGLVVSSKWLRRVQARSSFPPDTKGPGKSKTQDGPVGPVDNSDIAMVIEESGNLRDEAGEKFTDLRPGLAMGEDFEIMPQEAWELIVSWYGLTRTSPIITRYAHDTSDGDMPNVVYELNPPIWSFLKVVATHTPQTQKEKGLPPARMSNSRYTQFQTWLKEAKELLHIDLSTKVRVWRILGGLKNTSASGILTPVTSRSSSPAPGAELIANAGDKLLLDVNTFAALQLGEHRELLDVKDHTNDPNYNGKATLALHGLGRNDVIVLEEQASKSDDWPSENVRFSIGKSLQVKSKALTPSGRTSSAPGMMTRGRQRKDGRPKGITGLSNLGNTCYMNSALQSIRSVEELTQYFLRGQWKVDLNTNNPLGHGGNVAKAYAELLGQIYNDSTPSSVNPSRFKATIGKYGPSFSGYGQQDSQEFLLFLLDGLQEDLNRILKKPYIEKPDSTDEMVHDQRLLKEFADKNWDIYKARNDSVITDLFAGMYKSTVTCPVCDKVSIIFDPFNNLTLQLPVENTWSKEIIVFPLNKYPERMDVDLDKNATIKDIKEFVAKRIGLRDVDRLIMAESYKHKFFKFFNNADTIAESNISQNDMICIYELSEVPTNYNPNKKKKVSALSFSYSRDTDDELVAIDSPEADRLLIPVYHRALKQTSIRTARTFFGFPSLVVVSRSDAVSYDKIMRRLMDSVKNMTTKEIFGESAPASETELEDSDTLLVNDDESSSGSNLPKAASIEGEDGLVDVSMRDQSQPPSEAMDTDDFRSSSGRAHTALRPGFDSIFEIRIAATGEGIPTGWNSIEDSKMYPLMTERISSERARRRSNSQAAAAVENDEVSSSEEDVGDIAYKDSRVVNGSGSESGASVPPTSGNESDSSLPEAATIIKDTRGMHNRDRKKTYAARDRRKLQAANVRRAQVPAQHLVKRKQRPIVSADNDAALIRPGDALVLDWDTNAYDSLFGGPEDGEQDPMRGAPTWNNMKLFEDTDLVTKRAARTTRKKNGITLEDCLNEFGKTETLSEANAWYCPRCKEHRRARKMFELWKAPDILVMHLKRFSSNRSFRDKLDVRVDYPVEGLDLSSMVRDQEDGKSLIYDLIAVDNHYGGLGGGHYTAFAKNFVDGNWHDYNDSHASKKDESLVVTNAAYLLFYRRRTDGPLGGPALEKLVAEADSEAQGGSRDASPSGEGQRLGDSSHNGLSSAYPVDPVHRVGDGGLATHQNPMERDLALAGGGRLRMAGTDDALPSYKAIMNADDMLLDEETLGTAPPAPWLASPGWKFGGDAGLAGHANSDVDVMEDASSTRGEGASPPGQVSDFDEAEDPMLYSEDAEELNQRNVRESAPAPDIPSVNLATAADDDDDDDDLPVQELHAGVDGDMQFRPAGQK